MDHANAIVRLWWLSTDSALMQGDPWAPFCLGRRFGRTKNYVKCELHGRPGRRIPFMAGLTGVSGRMEPLGGIQDLAST